MSGKNVLAFSLSNQIDSSDKERELSIDSLLEHVLRLYPIPRINSRIVELEQAEKKSLDEFDNAIGFNPLFTAKQLVITRNSADNRSQAANAFADALRRVNPDELHHFALASDMLITYESKNALSNFYRECSMLAAMIARNISIGDNMVSTDRAFLSGLLSEIGAIACLKIDTSDFRSIWNQSGGLPVRRAELEIAQYGGTTHELGSKLLNRVGLPADVAEAVGTRVNEETKYCAPLARVTVFSRTVASELVRCSRRKHEQSLIGTFHKFGRYFNLTVDGELLANPSIAPLLQRDIK